MSDLLWLATYAGLVVVALLVGYLRGRADERYRQEHWHVTAAPLAGRAGVDRVGPVAAWGPPPTVVTAAESQRTDA